jgi:restriction endonuclease S subunit
MTDRRGITLIREQLEAWACQSLTDEQVEQLEDAIPNSSIPEAIATIIDSFDQEEEKDE